MAHVVVLGAGIAGVPAAHALERARRELLVDALPKRQPGVDLQVRDSSSGNA
jgi:predicted NAD/FAD-dependent oxidoreductase